MSTGTPLEASSNQTSSESLGTFFGVFLPSSLSIFGLMLYLRLGWIVGVGGLFYSTTIISLATLITLVTVFSIASTATNMPIGKGGVYFLLSRTFGIEAGCAIALPLLLAQILSISLYMVGLGDCIHMLYPSISAFNGTIVSLCLALLLSTLPLKIIFKTQLAVFILIVLSLASIALGLTRSPIHHFSWFSEKSSVPFWSLFALFFPAITGIESGLAMTADLKTPGKSLAIGSLGAVLMGYIVYLGLALLIGLFMDKEALVEDPLSSIKVARFSLIALLGLFCAGISGSISLFLTIPKTFQALAEDHIIPSFFGKEFGSDGSLRIGIAFVAILAYAGIGLGNLETIAPLVTMFFLLAYAMLNLATGVEAMIANPSWRPKIKTPWIASILGGMLCCMIMLMINAGATIISIFFVCIIYTWMKKRRVSGNWEDLRYSLLLFLSRFAIYRLAKSKTTAKNWRPNLMVFISSEHDQSLLIQLMTSITHQQGFLVFAQIQSAQQSLLSSCTLEHSLIRQNIPALSETVQADSLFEGIKRLTFSYGLGPLSPNTLVLSVPENAEQFIDLADMIYNSYLNKKNLILVKTAPISPKKSKKKKNIDVWWGGRSKTNSQFMIILAHMLSTSEEWKGSSLYLKTVASSIEDYSRLSQELDHDIKQSRLLMNPKIFLQMDLEDIFKETIAQNSLQTDLIFLGLKCPSTPFDSQEYANYLINLVQKTTNFPTLIFTLAAEEIAFDQILC